MDGYGHTEPQFGLLVDIYILLYVLGVILSFVSTTVNSNSLIQQKFGLVFSSVTF
jgi:hypothetical protein